MVGGHLTLLVMLSSQWLVHFCNLVKNTGTLNVNLKMPIKYFVLVKYTVNTRKSKVKYGFLHGS